MAAEKHSNLEKKKERNSNAWLIFWLNEASFLVIITEREIIFSSLSLSLLLLTWFGMKATKHA